MGNGKNGQRVKMNMMKTIGVVAMAGILAVLPLHAWADTASPSPNLYRSLEAHAPRNAGIIQGRIEAVDYSGGSIRVRGPHGVQTIAVVPSTTIYNGGGYATLSDLRSGQLVEIAAYEVGDRLVAQSIRLK